MERIFLIHFIEEKMYIMKTPNFIGSRKIKSHVANLITKITHNFNGKKYLKIRRKIKEQLKIIPTNCNPNYSSLGKPYLSLYIQCLV